MNIKSLLETRVQEIIFEAMKLDKVNTVLHDESSKHAAAEKVFIKHYTNGHKGDYAEGGPTEKHEKDSQFFHDNYERIDGKSGFMGSGNVIYKHKKTGDKFEVRKGANGKTFYGADHYISKLED